MLFLNILALTNEFEEECFGGAGTAATGIAHMLARQGVRQTIVVPRRDWSQAAWVERGSWIKVLGLPRNLRYFGHLGMVRVDVLRQEFPELWQEWDVIHIQAINFAPLAYALSGENSPILYSVYSILREELGDRRENALQTQFTIQEQLFQRSQMIHLVSESEKRYLEKGFPQLLSKIHVIPLGIELFENTWSLDRAKGFLYVGRLLSYKGIEDAIQALWKLGQSRQGIDLAIVGRGTEAYLGYLKQRVKSLKLEERVSFHGWLPGEEIRKRMAGAVSLIVPSRREAFGLTALEGMVTGVPVIASDAGGLTEVVTPACALIYGTGNVAQLAERMRTAVAQPELLKLLSQRGRERAGSFAWSALAPRYLKLLEQTRAYI